MGAPPRPSLIPAVLALAGLLALAPHPAAQEDRAEALVADEVHFAENLARYRFYDLATGVLDGVPVKGARDELVGTVEFTRARILRRQADTAASDEGRAALLGDAIARLQDWAKPGSRYAFHPRRADALQDLGEMLNLRGIMLGRAGDQAGAERDLRAADEAYTALERECEDLAKNHRENDEPEEAAEWDERRALTFYYRGKNSIDWADHTSDRDRRLERAEELLVDFQWEARSDTLPLFLAQHFEAVVREKRGRFEDARDLHEEVLRDARSAFWDEIQEFSAGARLAIADLMDLAWTGLARTQLALGDTAAAIAAAEAMSAAHAAASQPYGAAGLAAVLDLADLLGNAGETREASRLVKLVNDEGRGTNAGARAQRMLAEMLAGDRLGASQIDAPTLAAAAEGKLADLAYADAAFLYLKAAAALDGSPARKEIEPGIWMGAARALFRDGRELEAAIAYERLLAVAQAAKDAELVEHAASNMWRSLDRRYRRTNHAFDKELRDQASRRMTQLGIENNQAYNDALELFNDAVAAERAELRKDPARRDPDAVRNMFARAATAFESVDESNKAFERALIYRGRCLAGEGRFVEALERFDEMLSRAEDKRFAPTTADERTRRTAAVAQAVYYKADVLLNDAVARPDEALALLTGFEQRFADQTGFFEQVMFQRVVAHSMRHAVADADAALDALREQQPDSTFVALGAFRVARAYKQRHDGNASDGAAGGDPQDLARAAELMWEYARKSGFGNFGNTMLAGEWFARVGRHDDAETAYAAAVDTFTGVLGDDQLDKARLGLATALDRQLEFAKARGTWLDLLTRNARDPQVLRGAARSFGGWLDSQPDGTVSEIPGFGDHERALALWTDLYKGSDRDFGHWEIWWESKVGAVYCYYRMGKADPSNLTRARKLLNNQRVMTPEYDKQTTPDLPEEARFEPYFYRLFRYLDRNLPE